MKNPRIKIKPHELRKKSRKELLKMKKQMEFHLKMAQTPKHIGEKGFKIREERRNITRLNTILNEKNE